MLYIKDGYPETGEIVLCTVKKIYGNTTFVFLEEYEKEGVLTIAEIAPGRIRNLRDYVTETKRIVCKVLRVDEKGRRIDVSLRRVPIPVMKGKLEEIKKEDYADRIYQEVAQKINTTKEDLFEKTYEPIFEQYDVVFEALYDIMLDNSKVEMFTNLSQEEKNTLVEVINDRIKPEEVIFREKFHFVSEDMNGVEKIKSALDEALNSLNHKKIKVIYLAAGEFEIKIIHEDMKSADKVFNNFKKSLEEQAKKNNLKLAFKEK
jgi:translation initiation factor 2 alpha subunit (eIF-2alpha)